MKADSLCTACESVLDLSSASLSASYYYDSLPYCVIDAVFSIGVKYTSTQNVVKNYTHVTPDMQQEASHIVGGFLEDLLGKDLKPWQRDTPEGGARHG